MTDMTEFSEGKYVTPTLVKDSPTKMLVITQQAAIIIDDYKNRRPEFGVNIDARYKLWRPNQKSINNIKAEFGSDDAGWVGKRIALRVEMGNNNKEMVVAYPIPNVGQPQSIQAPLSAHINPQVPSGVQVQP